MQRSASVIIEIAQTRSQHPKRAAPAEPTAPSRSMALASFPMEAQSQTAPSPATPGTRTPRRSRPGQMMWLSTIQGTGTMGMSGPAFDSKGNVYVGGSYYDSTLMVGQDTLPVPTNEDGFLAKLDRNGKFVFVKAFSGTGNEGASPVVDGQDALYAAIGFDTGAVSVGTTMLTPDPDGNGDFAIVHLDASGNYVTHVGVVGPGSQYLGGLTGLPKGVALCATNNGTAKAFLGSDLVATGPGADVFFSKVFTAGSDWRAAFSAKGFCSGVSLDGSGDLTASGAYQSPVNFGGSTFPVDVPATDYFVRFSAANVHLWSDRAWGPDGYITNSTSDTGNNIYGGGTFRSNWNIPPQAGLFGSTTIYQNVTFKLNSMGKTLWKQVLGNITINKYAADSAGRLFGCGALTGDATFGTGPVVHQGSGDALVIGFKTTGEVFYVKTLGDAAYQQCGSIKVDAAGDLLVTGVFEGTIAADGLSASSLGAYDGFVTKIKAP